MPGDPPTSLPYFDNCVGLPVALAHLIKVASHHTGPPCKSSSGSGSTFLLRHLSTVSRFTPNMAAVSWMPRSRPRSPVDGFDFDAGIMLSC